ncbi:osmoprotectant transport system ATP-binding protein [Weissella uvarum]|uniref:ATP-binding cassette domain-containing protein n=1 Tax=Weissella uvarum TaxID=1479233 RepID=UPI00195F9880|nr:ABC transporter ATP-binding protein [Weissella uvarum]MBM7617011.1 osmoprotectant transport system ATP-binding protein [Weissella uvarum]MCM0595309.1 ABC transporter ATP-binding protein [Weissella uvarum]
MRNTNVETAPLIEFTHVDKAYQKQFAVHNLNLSIRAGEFFVLVGASGSGKTTTLKMINRLIEPTAGTITFAGRPLVDQSVNDLRHQIGYVLQDGALFPHLTVLENAAMTLNAIGVSTKDAKPQVASLLDEVGLDPARYLNRYPKELSGGEQQRVGIVRALVANPQVILMDEPFSALDPVSRKQLQDLVLNLHEKRQTTIVFVTHDMDETLRLGTRIGVMHQGHLEQVDAPSVLLQKPKNSAVSKLFLQQHGHTVSDVIAHGYYETGNGDEIPRVTVEQTLADLAQALLDAPNAAVLVNQNQVITQALYLEYMANQQE